MEIGYGNWLWKLAMEIGYGNWLLKLAMEIGYGNWLWKLAMEIGDVCPRLSQHTGVYSTVKIQTKMHCCGISMLKDVYWWSKYSLWKYFSNAMFRYC
jgi:hypothetical protein